jgi:UDP-N-acetyl-D-glucosamine dehydrogenase
LLEQRGTQVEFHDPLVSVISPTREHPELTGRKSIALSAATLQVFDCVLLVADHDAVDYRLVASHARLVMDTRNAFARKGISGDHIVKA